MQRHAKQPMNVVFLIYNRPELTRRVFRAIAGARPERLLVVADGPKDERDRRLCDKARDVIDGVDWPCEVFTEYSGENLGCKMRVSTGLDWAFEQVEEAIILEDDCLPHPSFFRYCNEQLAYFRDDARIGHISGNNFQRGGKRTEYSYYFSRFNGIWGWATWRRAWKYYDVDMRIWPEIKAGGWCYDIFPDTDIAEWADKLWTSVYHGEIDTWDAQWLLSCLVNGMYSVLPNVNLVANIGFGDNATRTVEKNDPQANLPVEEMVFPIRHPPYTIMDLTSDVRHFGFAQHNRTRRVKRLYLKLTNRHLYGSILRRIPYIGRIWAAHRSKRSAS